jgi:hypothetical protein
MSFNPLDHKGMPIEKQFRNWSELNIQPFDKNAVDPYTRCRVIVMNGIEVEGILHSHQFARHCLDMDVRRQLALLRRAEAQQQKAVNWLLPGDPSPLETTIAYEQVAVDLTAWLARNEPDPYVKQCLEFGLLEDFDHLYRYANLLDLIDSKRAEKLTDQLTSLVSGNLAAKVVKGLTEFTPGRPTLVEHRHPFDDVRKPTDSKTAHPLSTLHILTITAAEQQTMNFYMNAGNIPENPLARALYQEIAMIEEQHVSHYESLMDPNLSWYQGEVLHQYNEVYLYHSFMSQETDPRIRQLWELHLEMEIGQLQAACRLMEQYENRDPAEFLPTELPTPTLFEENKEYVRKVLESQINLTADGPTFVSIDELPKDHRYFAYQATVNAGGWVPSEEVIAEHCREFGGKDWREEVSLNPVPWLQQDAYGRRSNDRAQTISRRPSYYEEKALTAVR